MSPCINHVISSAEGRRPKGAQVVSLMLVTDGIRNIEDPVFNGWIKNVNAITFQPETLIRALQSTKRTSANENKWLCGRLLSIFDHVGGCSVFDATTAAEILFL